jgi:hypothetical protein
MGGLGSGEYDRPESKMTTATYGRIDCRTWARYGWLSTAGPREYRIPRDSMIGIYLWTMANGDSVDLCFRRWKDGKPEDWGHRHVKLVSTACHYGGERLWFCCPRHGCGRRVAVLYLAPGGIACRKCLDLRYVSQRHRAGNRALHNARKIRALLGASMDLRSPLPAKPEGMRSKTYVRLLEKAEKTETRLFDELANSPLLRLGKPSH